MHCDNPIIISRARFRLTLAGLLGLVTLAYATTARAEDSNRNEVRAELEKSGWRVIWGKNFTEGDWFQGTKAIVESTAADNPAPFLAWFGQTLDENFTKIERNLEGITRKEINGWIVQSLRDKTVVRYNGIRIQAGFATYNRWQREVHHEPRLRTQGIKSRVEMVEVENKIPLPNWHQFYIRYELTRPNDSAHPGVRRPSEVTVTFTNDAPYSVEFLLNGRGPLSRPLRLDPRKSQAFNLSLAPGFDPYVRVRQPDGTHQDFPLPVRDQRYRLHRTPQNRVVNVAE